MLDISSLRSMDEARLASRDCDLCHGEGLATVYHADYDGTNPHIVELGRDGHPRKRLTRTTAYCKCAAGMFITALHQREAKDVFSRMHCVADYETKGSLWSLGDPTLPAIDPGEVPDWQALRRQLAAELPSKIIHVKPARTPNRSTAYREMREPVPVVQEQL